MANVGWALLPDERGPAGVPILRGRMLNGVGRGGESSDSEERGNLVSESRSKTFSSAQSEPELGNERLLIPDRFCEKEPFIFGLQSHIDDDPLEAVTEQLAQTQRPRGIMRPFFAETIFLNVPRFSC